MAHVQKPYFIFRRNGRVHLNRLGHQFSRLLAAEVCASALIMMDTPCSEIVWRVLATHSIRQFPLHFPSHCEGYWLPTPFVSFPFTSPPSVKGIGYPFHSSVSPSLPLPVWRVLATHSIRQFPLHFPSHASPCAITFQLDCTNIAEVTAAPRQPINSCGYFGRAWCLLSSGFK